MTVALSQDAKQDLLRRGYSRRHFGRISALLGVQAVAAAGGLSIGGGAVRAAPITITGLARKPDLQGMVRIGSNECWTGHPPPRRERPWCRTATATSRATCASG